MRHGARIQSGGDMEKGHKEFIEWAAQYDDGILSGRSLKRHEKWMKSLHCPILRIEGQCSVEASIKKIRTKLIELNLVKRELGEIKDEC